METHETQWPCVFFFFFFLLLRTKAALHAAAALRMATESVCAAKGQPQLAGLSALTRSLGVVEALALKVNL